MGSIDMARPFVKKLHRTKIKNQHQVDSCPNYSLNLRPREFLYIYIFSGSPARPEKYIQTLLLPKGSHYTAKFSIQITLSLGNIFTFG
jgi:hypothetical protein